MHQTVIESYLKKIKQSIVTTREAVTGWKYRTARLVGERQYDRVTDWRELRPDQLFAVDETVFLETLWQVPEQLNDTDEAKDYLFFGFKNFEGLVYINDQPYHGVDKNRDRIHLPRNAAGSTLKLTIELCCIYLFDEIPDKPRFLHSEFGTVNKPLEKLYYDLKLAWETLPFVDNEYCRVKIMEAIDGALRFLDVSLERDAYIRQAIDADARLMSALQIIRKDLPHGNIALIGHTHIDIAWLWRLQDTVGKAGRTFSNMIRMMEEYPQFTFTCSQPKLYEYVKIHYPDLYEQVKILIASGRWEVVGPMWVEADCNLVSGESLARHLLYGHEFFRQEFGIVSPICWLPDTFGFQGNMPQILRKGGIRHFFSYKLHWQSENEFPLGAFRWQGIDGSEVVSAVPNLKEGYNGYPSPDHLTFAVRHHPQKAAVDEVMHTYGWGDGGGGPDRNMIEYALRLEDFPGLPSCRLASAADYFAKLDSMAGQLPVWYGELYHESHRGTYTSVGKVKKWNRYCEQLFRQLEIVNVLAEQHGKRTDWSDIKAQWKTILTLQFHDILPGSSIKEVYADAYEMYEKTVRQGEAWLEDGMQFMKNAVCQPEEQAIVVMNALSWERTDKVAVIVDSALAESGRLRIEDADGQDIAYVVRTAENNRPVLEFVAEAVPSIGYKKYRLRREPSFGADHPALPRPEPDDTAASADRREVTMENPYFRLAINPDGTLARLFDKINCRDVLPKQAGANAFKLFLDGPQVEDAWNIYGEYQTRLLDTDWDNSLDIVENNAVRMTARLIKKRNNVTICQNIVLYRQLNRIDFVTKVDWREKHKVMKVTFPVDVLSPVAAYEIGFGAIQRPTYANNPYEKSKFEVYGHKWVDLSEEGYGVSLLNDCKYGHDIQGNQMSITLLRGTDCPGADCDSGIHEFIYSLYPHREDWRKGQTVRKGWELNCPLLAIVNLPGRDADDDDAPRASDHTAQLSYIRPDNPNIVLDTVKTAEDGDGIILRFYECNGSRGPVNVDTVFPLDSLDECDLLEMSEQRLEIRNCSFSFSIKPFEVRTFRLRIRR